MHPIVYARNPDEVLYDADLGDSAWEAKTGINVLSTQATFDIPVEGETANGLRISLARGTFFAETANDVLVVTAVDSTLAAATAAYVEADANADNHPFVRLPSVHGGQDGG